MIATRTWPLARPRQAPNLWLIAWAAGLIVYLLARPALSLIHELAILGATGLFNQIHHERLGSLLVQHLPADPIYTGAVAALLSDVDAVGLALTGPIGSVLHSHWPAFFLDPDLAQDGAFVSALILPGSTMVARGLSFLLADVVVLAVGWAVWLWATSGPRSAPRLALALGAAVQQLHVVIYHHLVNRVALQDLESLGVPFALSALQRGAPQDRPRVTAWLVSVPTPITETVVNMLAATIAVTLSLLLVVALRWAWRRAVQLLRSKSQPAGPAWDPSLKSIRHLLWVPALLVAASPVGAVLDADSRVIGIADGTVIAVPAADTSLAATPAAAPAAAAVAPSAEAAVPSAIAVLAPPMLPTRVSIDGGDFHYRYLVNDQPSTIRGIGYNVRYRHLPAEERRALYDRDFALMRSMGINTIVGWEAREFDELTLDRAAAYGLGVVPPFELRPDIDYTDAALREQIVTDVVAWIHRYKDQPAVRMWQLGNEILHKLVFPSWMSVQAEPSREDRARAFGQLLVTLADRAHAEDPMHPVVYTDAEDAYVRYVREAMLADGQHRPWFVYGINAYTPRLRSMIESWPTVGFDTPLFISEFAPGGLSPQDRPSGLRDMWEVVQSFDDRLLGGAVYAWSTEGPEEVDRVFGLVDSNTQPVDGALSAVARMYGGDIADSPSATPSGADESDEPIGQVVRTAFLALPSDTDDADSDEAAEGVDAAESPGPGGQMQVARVIDGNAGSPDDADVGNDSWWITWRSSDAGKQQVAMLVERGDDGQPRVSYMHRLKQ
ncbi:MAG TPA: hypothetical protein VHX16_17290 [Chloroflexota bacterium]|nr:hypothetical protein [Chloroflexota bacterium]